MEDSGFLMLRPKMPFNSYKIAKKIATFKGVDEVNLTSGEYAFVISISGNLENIKKSIRRTLRKTKMCIVTKHHSYTGV